MPSAASEPMAPKAKRCSSTFPAVDFSPQKLDPPAHQLVKDSGFLINLGFRGEAVAAIELQRLQLRGKHDLRMAALARFLRERLQDRGADAPAAPVLYYRHAADMAVQQQAAGADRLAGLVVGDGVDAVGVLVVELDAGRHVLLADENGEADR